MDTMLTFNKSHKSIYPYRLKRELQVRSKKMSKMIEFRVVEIIRVINTRSRIYYKVTDKMLL